MLGNLFCNHQEIKYQPWNVFGRIEKFRRLLNQSFNQLRFLTTDLLRTVIIFLPKEFVKKRVKFVSLFLRNI